MKFLLAAAAAGGAVWYLRKYKSIDLLTACGWKKLAGMKDCQNCGGCVDSPFTADDKARMEAAGWTSTPVNSSEGA